MTPSIEPPVYDRIGAGYAATRRPDPRIAAAIRATLGDARTLVNVGAGAGAYEPHDCRVVAVEPSRAMIGQRPAGAAPCIQAVAERLPFRDRAVDASLAILTIHHWTDQAAGLAELRRVHPAEPEPRVALGVRRHAVPADRAEAPPWRARAPGQRPPVGPRGSP